MKENERVIVIGFSLWYSVHKSFGFEDPVIPNTTHQLRKPPRIKEVNDHQFPCNNPFSIKAKKQLFSLVSSNFSSTKFLVFKTFIAITTLEDQFLICICLLGDGPSCKKSTSNTRSIPSRASLPRGRQNDLFCTACTQDQLTKPLVDKSHALSHMDQERALQGA